MNKLSRHTLADLTVLQRRRLSWSIAKGTSLAKAAKRAGLKAPLARELAEDEGFSGLVEAYRSMAAMGEDERHRRLVALAIRVLQDAMISGQTGIALFILKQRDRDRCPAEVLANGVIKSLERSSPKPKPEQASGDPRDRSEAADATQQQRPRPYQLPCPIDSATNRAAASLRAQIMDEVEIEAAAHQGRKVKIKRRSGTANRSRPNTRFSPKQLALLASILRPGREAITSPPEIAPSNPNAPN